MGNWYIDISNWDSRLYDYSKKLICNSDIIQYNESEKHFFLSVNEAETLKRLVFDPVSSHLYWLGLAIGIEIFIKSILIKYKVLPITNRKITQKYPKKQIFYSLEEQEEYFSDDIAMVYRACTKRVISRNNKWIADQLKESGIGYIYDIKTPTLGWLYNKGFKKLHKINIIDKSDLILLERSLETFTDIRRNVDCHIFIGRTVGSIQKDREKIYLPMLNKLNKIYQDVN